MKYSILVIISVFLMLFQNCSPEHSGEMSSVAGTLGAESVQIFSQTVHPILVNNCGSCHGQSQAPLHSVSVAQESHDRVVQMRLVDFSAPDASRLVTKIRGGHEGIAQSIADSMQAEISAWVQAVNESGGGTGVEPIVLEATFSSINALILQPKCATCHNPNGERRSEDYSTYESTVATGKLNGDFWTEIVNDDMPTGQGSMPLSDEEKSVIRAWLDDGFPNN